MTTGKVTLVAPAGTVTLSGTDAKSGGPYGVSRTSAPPAGAGPLRATVPSVVPPGETGFGLRVSSVTTGASTWSRAAAPMSCHAARISTFRLVPTAVVVI